jgi:hypothetical protein
MTLNPAIIALTLSSLLGATYALYAAGLGVQISRHWDLTSGSERQLRLERRTYLVSTILLYLLVLTIGSLFFFAYTADSMHDQILGAMCAAGSFNAHPAGYPALMMKIANVLLCGLWLVMNHTDNQAEDYPLIKSKYRLLSVIAGCLTIESMLTIGYFAGLKTDVITSCCGTLFSDTSGTLSGHIAALPPKPTAILFFVMAALILRVGVHFRLTGRHGKILGVLSAALFPVTLAAVLSFISVYYYELPTHHCPFCLLQADYRYIGYPLYAALFTAVIAGSSVGVLERFKRLSSLRGIIPAIQKKLCTLALGADALLIAIAAYPMVFSSFKLHA